jgi:hypothetical protein
MERIRIDGHADQKEETKQEGVVFEPDIPVPQKFVHDMNLCTTGTAWKILIRVVNTVER